MESYVSDQQFTKQDYTSVMLPKGEYENCTFTECNFFRSDLRKIKFSECEFIGCDLSLAILTDTALRDVRFRNCKMLGLQFNSCNQFGISFTLDGCNLSQASFYKLRLKNAHFRNSQFTESDLTECDLTGARLENCDFGGVTFDRTILEKADLSTSYNIFLDPEINKIRKAKLALSGLPGLLAKYDLTIV